LTDAADTVGADLDDFEYTLSRRCCKIDERKSSPAGYDGGHDLRSRKAVDDGEGGEHEGQDYYFDELAEF
jgi:hypothetical protein